MHTVFFSNLFDNYLMHKPIQTPLNAPKNLLDAQLTPINADPPKIRPVIKLRANATLQITFKRPSFFHNFINAMVIFRHFKPIETPGKPIKTHRNQSNAWLSHLTLVNCCQRSVILWSKKLLAKEACG